MLIKKKYKHICSLVQTLVTNIQRLRAGLLKCICQIHEHKLKRNIINFYTIL